MHPLSPKDRVLTAFAHSAVDRVPMDYSGNAGITRRLCGHFAIPPHAPDAGRQLRLALHTDFRYAEIPCVGPCLHADYRDEQGEVHVDEWGIRRRWVEHESGGYMLSPCHAIQDNTPTENVLAMYDEGLRFRP